MKKLKVFLKNLIFLFKNDLSKNKPFEIEDFKICGTQLANLLKKQQ